MYTVNTKTTRAALPLVMLFALLCTAQLAGCNVQDDIANQEARAGELCSRDGDRSGELECRDGRWQRVDLDMSTQPDLPVVADQPTDSPVEVPDQPVEADMPAEDMTPDAGEDMDAPDVAAARSATRRCVCRSAGSAARRRRWIAAAPCATSTAGCAKRASAAPTGPARCVRLRRTLRCARGSMRSVAR